MAAVFGFLLLVAGLIGAAILYVMSVQRPDKAVESFARAAAGCTTSLDFSETGTFFVYEETTTTFDPATIGCTPTPAAGQVFEFALTGPAPANGLVTTTPDLTVFYDSGSYAGSSVARFEVTAPGTYEIRVASDNVNAVAAVGRDPESGVDEVRRNAIAVGAIGVVLGLLLLLLAGWRSKKATAPTMPDGPGWGQRPGDRSDWPSTPEVPRVPINPQQPDVPVSPTPPPPPLPAREPGAGLVAPSWSPPPAGDRPVSSDAPVPPPPVRTPQPKPVLPDTEGTVSGMWPSTQSTPPPPPPPGSPPPPPPGR